MSRATFGDFLQAAHDGLGPPSGAGSYAPRGSVEEVSRSLLRVVTVMGRYVQDMTAGLDGIGRRARPPLHPWARACLQVREALSNAAWFLTDGGPNRRWPPSPAASPLARRLDAVTVSLTTGRDLLQTHFAPGAGSSWEHRSEWAVVVTSPPVTRALLAEIALLSRRIAHQGAGLALSPPAGVPGSAPERRRLNAACQWLWVLDTSVRAAQQQEPVAAADRDLMAAIPVNDLPPRRVPGGGEPVAVLCEGAITSAERVRHLAWVAAQDAPWSPGMSTGSLRQVARTSTVTSHNCHILLGTLAACTARAGQAQISEGLSAAADAAGRARDRWLRAACAIGQITTETEGHLSPAAIEAGDLALWTGRLAYADPQWTLVSGPAHPGRPPESLVSRPEDVPMAVAAVHQACETLAQLPQTEWEQISAAAQVGRILVPTSTLSSDYDVPRPFARAPHDRVEQLLAEYRGVAQASRQAATAVGEVAVAIQASSRVLVTARQAARASQPTRASKTADHADALAALRDPGAARESAAVREPDDTPGPIEHTLRGLGVSRPDLLTRGAELDRAGQRFLIDATVGINRQHKRPSAVMLSKTTATAALVNNALASGDSRAAAMLRGPQRPQQAESEAEREP